MDGTLYITILHCTTSVIRIESIIIVFILITNQAQLLKIHSSLEACISASALIELEHVAQFSVAQPLLGHFQQIHCQIRPFKSCHLRVVSHLVPSQVCFFPPNWRNRIHSLIWLCIFGNLIWVLYTCYELLLYQRMDSILDRFRLLVIHHLHQTLEGRKTCIFLCHHHQDISRSKVLESKRILQCLYLRPTQRMLYIFQQWLLSLMWNVQVADISLEIQNMLYPSPKKTQIRLELLQDQNCFWVKDPLLLYSHHIF